MSNIEAEEKGFSPESIMERESPQCCAELKKKGCSSSNNSLNENEQKADHHGQLKKNQKAKGKLVRSAAVCDEVSPAESNSKVSESENTLTVNRSATAKCDEASQDKQKESIQKKANLSKEPSQEYTDSTGIDLEEFLITTLKSSPRDRLMLLKLEQDMTDFMADNSSYKKFPQMSSYHRMLVHRVAAYFGLEHNVDHTGKAVIINKTSNSRIPEQCFADHVQEEKNEERRSILRRDGSQEKEEGQMGILRLKEQTKSKSFEEREEEYQKARDRIFSQDPSCPAQTVYIETRGPEEFCNIYSETQRRRQLFWGSRNSSGQQSGSRQSSFELEGNYESRPWSSTDSDSSTWGSKPTLSHSDSNSKISKPVTEATVNNPAYVVVPPESSILPGSILINPQTGQPYLNPDGSPAVYNPPGNQQPMCSQLNTMQAQPTPPHYQSATSHSVPQVQYSSVTYLPPQQLLPVSSSQVNPPEPSKEDFSLQFGQMTVNHQLSGDASDVPCYYVHGAAPSHSYTQPQHSYAPSFSEDSYMSSEMTMALSGAPAPQACAQQSTGASLYSYPGQSANINQQYGTAGYSTHTGYATVLGQQQVYPSMVGHQVLTPPMTQKCIMGPYPSTNSCQVQSFHSTVLVPRQTGQNQSAVPPAGVPVYCNPLSASPPLCVGISCQSGNCRNACNRNQNPCWY